MAGKNHYVADLIQEIDAPNRKYIIEYKYDQEELDKLPNFDSISCCNPAKGRRFVVENKVPWFIKERLPNETRRDLPAYLKKYGLEVYDFWELLKRSHGAAISNRYFVETVNTGSDYTNEYFDWQVANYKKNHGIVDED